MEVVNMPLNVENTINFQNMPETTSYRGMRERETQEIIKKLKEGLKPKRYNNYYMELGGKTYNGWSKEDVERLAWKDETN